MTRRIGLDGNACALAIGAPSELASSAALTSSRRRVRRIPERSGIRTLRGGCSGIDFEVVGRDKALLVFAIRNRWILRGVLGVLTARQARERSIQIGAEEERNRITIRARHVQHAVWRGQPAVIRPAAQKVRSVDQEF